MKNSDLMGYVVLIALATMIGIMAGWGWWKAFILAWVWLGIMEILRTCL